MSETFGVVISSSLFICSLFFFYWLEPFVIDVCQNKTCSNEYITCFPYSTYIENLAVLVPS